MEATLEAVKRRPRGKNEARRLRAAGQIPAVVYGAQKEGDAGADHRRCRSIRSRCCGFCTPGRA